jgi:hypothetical protein
LHIREIDGKKADLKSLKMASGKQLMLTQANVLGEDILSGSVELKPFETKFIKLNW